MNKIKESGQGALLYIGLIALVLFIALGLAALLSMPNRITDERALPRLSEISGIPADQIQVVHKTNDSPLFGDSYDVSYELILNGKRETGRCTVAGWWSDMVCRIYTGAE